MKKRRSVRLPNFSKLAYSLLGRRLDLLLPYFEDLENDLKRAGMKITLSKYVSKMLMVTIIALLIAFSASLAVLILRTVPLYAIAMSLGIGFLAGGIAFWIMYTRPTISANSRKSTIEREMNFAVNYMAILAGAGVIPERIFKSLSASDLDATIKDELSEVVRRMDVLGEDFYTSLRRGADESSSKQFADLLRGILMVERTGGDLKRYLHLQSRHYMRLRRISMKKSLDMLSVLAEVYVTGGIVLPLVIIIMLAAMSLVGGGGINILATLYFAIFLLIPVISSAILIIVDASVPKEE